MDSLIQDLRAAIGREAVLTEPDELLVYECDGLPHHKFPPRAVLFPNSTEEVSAILRVLARSEIPFAPRGAGTGLSGGALAIDRGVIIELARMRRLLKLDAENRVATVETGMINAHVSRAAAPYGLHYVPDPSSQMTCTIGGNIAENAGGIHCLKYGMTVDHVLSARVVLAGGEIVDLGGTASETVGYDLLGVYIGSEGTFGIATEATLRLVPLPAAVRTLLAEFTSVDQASHAVSAIIAAGLIPAALEMIDGVTIRAVEASVFAAGLPLDAEAALLIELDGLEAGLDEEALRAEALCRQFGARSVRLATDDKERKRFWAARKGAFGAMGRVSPDLMLQDAVVPRSRLPGLLAETYRTGAKYDLRIANLFHAGDGNLHPVICFDSRDPEQVRRVKEAGREIMETCVAAGGTITGEHGVGLDKSEYLPLIFSSEDMETMLRVRAAFDPSGLCNPGKIIPTLRGCGEGRAAVRRQETDESGSSGSKTLVVDGVHSTETSFRRLEAGYPPPPVRDFHDGEQSLKSLRAANPLAHSAAQPVSSPSYRPPVLSASLLNAGESHLMLAQIVGADNVRVSAHFSMVAPPPLEVAPSSAAEASEVLRLATRERWSIIPSGAGTWLDVGNPLSRAAVIVSSRRMQRVLEHEPADLVATAEAGLTLETFSRQLGEAGQWLPLDPPDDGHSTLGGIVATGMPGAMSYGFGATRSHVIGMRAALADGTIIKAGGRVVKNVAGYDLCKLFTGSYGTLCMILELTFKLRPRPAQTATIVASGSVDSLMRSSSAILNAGLLPVAVELLSAGLAERLSLPAEGDRVALLIRYAGTPETVGFQTEKTIAILNQHQPAASCSRLGDEANYWRTLAAIPQREPARLTWRASMPQTKLATFIESWMREGGPAFSSESLWHAGLADGRLRVMSNSNEETGGCVSSLQRMRAIAKTAGGSFVIESASREIKQSIDAWGDFGSKASLMRRVKKELDPNDMLSPGRFMA